MTGTGLVGLAFLLLFIVCMCLYGLAGRRLPIVLRPHAVLDFLRKVVQQSVEAGGQIHVSLGTGSIAGSDAAPALMGLTALERVAQATAVGDKPALATAGDGSMLILAQDVLRLAHEQVGEAKTFRLTSAQMLGPTPLAYAAGVPSFISPNGPSVNVLLGSFGTEGALVAAMGEDKDTLVIAGADDVRTQAMLYAIAQYPLIGEEIFATGAYLEAGGLHRASLRTQDVVRIVLILVILLGALLLTLGVRL